MAAGCDSGDVARAKVEDEEAVQVESLSDALG